MRNADDNTPAPYMYIGVIIVFILYTIYAGGGL